MHSFSVYGTSFDVTLLNDIAESTQASSIPVSTIAHMLDRMTWSDDEGHNFAPRTILRQPSKSPEHFERIQEADCEAPILVSTKCEIAAAAGKSDVEDSVVVVDGMHRLALAFATGLVSLPCKTLSRSQLVAARLD